jgi:uncharacterized C2H2 Zn-finger protein
METIRCPRCQAHSRTGGLIPGSRGGGPICFIPDGCRKSGFWLGVRFRDAEFLACLSCGLVWSELRPDELRAYIERHGDAVAKSRLPGVKDSNGDGALA